MNATKNIQTAHNKAVSRIYGHGRGWVFTPNDFRDLGTRQAIGAILRRLVNRGVIQRVGHGLYQYPVRHPTIGIINPSPEAVARALAGRTAARLLPSGAYAANILGLSQQVPARITFLTDAPSKTVRLGRQVIQLKQTVTRNMATADRISGTVIQALRFIGRKNVDERVIKALCSRLTEGEKKILAKDAKYAPGWLEVFLRQIVSSR